MGVGRHDSCKRRSVAEEPDAFLPRLLVTSSTSVSENLAELSKRVISIPTSPGRVRILLSVAAPVVAETGQMYRCGQHCQPSGRDFAMALPSTGRADPRPPAKSGRRGTIRPGKSSSRSTAARAQTDQADDRRSSKSQSRGSTSRSMSLAVAVSLGAHCCRSVIAKTLIPWASRPRDRLHRIIRARRVRQLGSSGRVGRPDEL